MPDYREIGSVCRLQIQKRSLKTGEKPRQQYDPGPVQAADRLDLADGRITVEEDGETFLDVHSPGHPESKNRDRGDHLSVGFTSHYVQMRDRFGPHLTDGLAAENLLVEYDDLITLSDLEKGLVLQGRDGRRIEFDEVLVAHPCVEFSRFCLGDPDADPAAVKETLQFLDNGMRGYYIFISSGLPGSVEVGDRLLARV